MIGLWHYPIPGFFLLAQFGLGILVALGNLVNNSVFLYLSNEEEQLSDDNKTEEGTITMVQPIASSYKAVLSSKPCELKSKLIAYFKILLCKCH